MSGHEQFADDLALYALGALQGEESAALEKHIESCAGCRRELEFLRGDSALLALSVSGPKPPQRSRDRLLKAVTRESKFRPAPRRSWWGVLGWATAAAMSVVAINFIVQYRSTDRQLAIMSRAVMEQQADLEKAREVVQTLTATDAMQVTLVAAKNPPQPQGKAMYLRDRSSLIFMASNMPKLPSQKAYELWLIPMKGAPIPAGMFKPDTRGSGVVINPPLPLAVEAKAFAVTVEPDAGSSTPTMPIVLMGAGE